MRVSRRPAATSSKYKEPSDDSDEFHSDDSDERTGRRLKGKAAAAAANAATASAPQSIYEKLLAQRRPEAEGESEEEASEAGLEYLAKPRGKCVLHTPCRVHRAACLHPLRRPRGTSPASCRPRAASPARTCPRKSISIAERRPPLTGAALLLHEESSTYV